MALGRNPYQSKTPPLTDAERKAKGRAGEVAMNRWLAEQGLSYVSVCQSIESFAPLFTDNVKRPDFLVLLESVGLIAVDAKNYERKNDEYTLELDKELRTSIAFERLFRISVWYAYLDTSGTDVCWYWISALKAVEVGAQKTSDKNGKTFLAIKTSHFERVVTGSDLAKLYTHRLPSTRKISGLPL